MGRVAIVFLAFLIGLIPFAIAADSTKGPELVSNLWGSAVGALGMGFYTLGAFLGAGAGTASMLIAIFLFIYLWYLLKQILYDFSPFSEGVATIVSFCFVIAFAVSKVIGWVSDFFYSLFMKAGKMIMFLSAEQATVVIGLIFFIILYVLTSWISRLIAGKKIKAAKKMNQVKEEAGKSFFEKVGDAIYSSK